MSNSKLSQFADCVHSSIPFSNLEKLVISTTLFNRLHNILQNSGLYLTYPCSRTSRFSHSLGCMHLAGEMFRYAVVNAGSDVQNEFFGSIRTATADFQHDKQFHTQSGHILAHASAGFEPLDPSQLSDHLYVVVTPATIKEAHQLIYVLCYQSVRLVGLLHDLGHPPFSHVTEDALVRLAASVESSRESKAVEFVKLMRGVWLKNRAFHEDLGLVLVERLLDRIVERLTDEIASADDITRPMAIRRAYDALMVKHLTIKILKNEGPLFKGMHDIVDGEIDADRLDYVVRDLFAAGIYRDSIQYNRLLSSYTLHLHRLSGKPGHFAPQFLPSTRALSTIEDFFWQRLFLYRYVIFHHRVAKMDGLLREALVELGRRFLLSQPPFEEISNPDRQSTGQPKGAKQSNLLPVHISSLWTPLSIDRRKHDHLSNVFSQWDDSLLLTILRQRYFADPTQVGPLSWQLDELLSNRKHYTSVVKRVDDFLQIDSAFIRSAMKETKAFAPKYFRRSSMSTDADPQARKAALEVKKVVFAALENILKNCKLSLRGGKKVKGGLPTEGLFLAKLCQALKLAGFDETKFLYGATEALQDKLRKKSPDTHLFLVRKELQPGVSEGQYIATDHGRVRLAEVSDVVEEMRRTAAQFPPFFLYAHFSGHTLIDLTQLRETFGVTLFAQFKSTYLRKESK